ncbi:Zuotin, partial [Kickxella alabastrina]
MASTVTLPLAPLGMGPETGNAVVIHAAISPPRSLILYRAGQAYSAYHRRRQNNSTEADDYEQHILPQDLARTKVESEVVIPEALVLDEVTKDLLDLDPAEWKKQDHYLVLGLSSLRYKATQAQIKKAHQMRALQFHPDKSASTGNSHNETFFKCVQRAYELLTDPVRRPQFDSVDPTISDDIPKARLGSSGQDFFSTYGPVFEREGRFSKKQPVPMLGDMDAPREEMEAFYRFWTQFDSWRSYEYLDKENDQLENREEKRWHEKKNKTERTRLKKEDTKRVSTLVQQAMSADPRIGKYKAMERLEKDKKRLAREAAVKKAESERLCAEEEKRKQALQRAEQEAQVAAEERLRREKIKKEYRLIKRSVREAAKQYNYLLDANSSAPAALARRSAELDLLLENISQDEALELQSVFTSGACDQVQILAAMVEAISGVIAKTPAVASSFTSFTRGADIAARVKQEKQKETDKAQLPAKTQREWTAKELELLIKATNKFPGGTIDRWET